MTWLALLADGVLGLVAGLVAQLRGRYSGLRGRPSLGFLVLELAVAVAIVVPAGLAAPTTRLEVDESRDMVAADWIDRMFVALPPNTVVISWWSFSTPLWYGRDVEGRRPDIAIIDDRTILDENLGGVTDVIDQYLGKRPVYVIRLAADMDTLARRYELLPVPSLSPANLALVVGRRAGAP